MSFSVWTFNSIRLQQWSPIFIPKFTFLIFLIKCLQLTFYHTVRKNKKYHFNSTSFSTCMLLYPPLLLLLDCSIWLPLFSNTLIINHHFLSTPPTMHLLTFLYIVLLTSNNLLSSILISVRQNVLHKKNISSCSLNFHLPFRQFDYELFLLLRKA